MKNIPDFSHHPDCEKCPVSKKLSRVGIGGWGSPNCDILIVGAAPFKQETKDGIAFSPGSDVGRAIRNIVEKIESRSGLEFRFTYAIRCMLTQVKTNDRGSYEAPRRHTPAELKNCLPYLHEEIKRTKPRVLVLMGADALHAVLGWRTAIGEVRGKVFWSDDGKLAYIPTYAPINMVRSFSTGNNDYSKALKPDQVQDMIVTDLITAVKVATGSVTKPEEININTVESDGDALEVLSIMAKVEEAALDYETNSYSNTLIDTQFKTGFKLTSLALAPEPLQAYVIPLDHPQAPWKASAETKSKFMKRLWKLPWRRLGQNVMYDLVAGYMVHGLDPYIEYHDSMYLHHLLYNNQKHDLDTLTLTYMPQFGGYAQPFKEMVAKLPVPERGYHKVGWKPMEHKNGYDAGITKGVVDIVRAEVWTNPELRWIYENITVPFSHTLMEMSMRGIYFDLNVAREYAAEIKLRRYRIMKQLKQHPSFTQTEKLIGKPIKKLTPIIKQTMLFHSTTEAIPIRAISKKSNMPSLKKEHMEIYAHENPVAAAFQYLGNLEAAETKVIKPLPKWIGFDGRVHTEYRVVGTRTGRISSSKPNLLNIPQQGKSPIKDMMFAGDGYVLLYSDVSQAELRVLAHMTQERVMLQDFIDDIDVHSTVGSEMFGMTFEEVQNNEDIRSKVKRLQFGLLYGMTAEGLSRRLHVSKKEAQNIVDLYFQKFADVKQKLFRATEREMMKQKYTTSLFGRRWSTSKDLTNEITRSRVMRQAINFRIQSTSSDIVARAAIGIRKMLREGYDEGVAYMSNEIYDSITIECRVDKANEIGKLMSKEMQNPDLPFKLSVPWKADMKIGKVLGKMYSMEPWDEKVVVLESR